MTHAKVKPLGLSRVSIAFPSHFGTSQFTVGAFNNFDHDEATRGGGSNLKVGGGAHGERGARAYKAVM